MNGKRVVFSPVTRLSGLLSVEVFLDKGKVAEANVSGTMFRGYEWIMRGRQLTDAVYMTQRICGICSLAHGAVSSYLLDKIFDNELTANAQYLRNIMYAADFLQNHIRHFYLFSLPDFVRMPPRPPFHRQDVADLRLSSHDNLRLAGHYAKAVKAAQQSHEILTLFGGKVPHQHSFLHGGVATAPTADKVNRALALCGEISAFVRNAMMPDTELIAGVYSDYFNIGVTPRRLLSFGLFKFGAKNERLWWPSGVTDDGQISVPDLQQISEHIGRSWFEDADNSVDGPGQKPAPQKPGAYTWVKSVTYAGRHFQVGPLARLIITGQYQGGTSTMDRIYARSLETLFLSELLSEWLKRLEPGPPPIHQKHQPVLSEATAATDSMRGALLHSARISGDTVTAYNIITPTAWNFSPKSAKGERGPAESALVGAEISKPDMLFTVLGRIVRSFDPCIPCATHVLSPMKPPSPVDMEQRNRPSQSSTFCT
jgi:hydrogenase large subunit